VAVVKHAAYFLFHQLISTIGAGITAASMDFAFSPPAV
jgi:hypothetical protein